ncbi:MAG: hypothetical protein GX492_11780 [Firmicutes bacterium]|nr:hypothetical protein [Bacillota bacterium]
MTTLRWGRQLGAEWDAGAPGEAYRAYLEAIADIRRRVTDVPGDTVFVWLQSTVDDPLMDDSCRRPGRRPSIAHMPSVAATIYNREPLIVL